MIMRFVPDILTFLPILFVYMLGYAMLGHLLFGLRETQWASFDGSFARVFEFQFGLYDVTPLYEFGPMGYVYVFLAIFMLSILLINVMLAIILAVWDSFREQSR